MSAPLSTKHAIAITDFVERRSSTLRGFATVQMPSGLILNGVATHVANDRPWASPPSKPVLDRNGMVTRDADGKVRYSPIISFASNELRHRFSDAVIEALRIAYPTALQ